MLPSLARRLHQGLVAGEAQRARKAAEAQLPPFPVFNEPIVSKRRGEGGGTWRSRSPHTHTHAAVDTELHCRDGWREDRREKKGENRGKGRAELSPTSPTLPTPSISPSPLLWPVAQTCAAVFFLFLSLSLGGVSYWRCRCMCGGSTMHSHRVSMVPSSLPTCISSSLQRSDHGFVPVCLFFLFV